VYESYSGQLVNGRFPYPRERYLWLPGGAIVLRKGANKYIFRKLPGREPVWTVPIEPKGPYYLVPVRNLPVALEADRFALIDPARKEVRWNLSERREETLFTYYAAYSPHCEEIFVVTYIGESNERRKAILAVDAHKGKIRSEASITRELFFRAFGNVPANGKHLIVWKSVHGVRDGDRKEVARPHRILRRDDGKMLPGVRLPHLRDLPESGREPVFHLYVVGRTLVFSNGKRMLAYGHDADGTGTDSR
jgi:hypothetical protein